MLIIVSTSEGWLSDSVYVGRACEMWDYGLFLFFFFGFNMVMSNLFLYFQFFFSFLVIFSFVV